MWYSQTERRSTPKPKQEHYFIFQAKCYKRISGDDIVFRETHNSTLDYGINNKPYLFIGEYLSYDEFDPKHAVNLYLRKHPRALIDRSEVFIMQNESNEEKNVFLIYYSKDNERWEVIPSNNEDFVEWQIITIEQSKLLYENFKNFIDDYNNHGIMSVLEEKYLTHPIKIGEQN